ncbi:predicted protein [Nematostella vectensis]|uniref:Tudor domain-containing protein n=1 Tax=Nematostella vectensis TaxID=45351 RepID=A7SWQ8_NEMVE|nr:predicted protein [Nematostella vectensis]|eukprot:XP_001623960.1 predicted protein [Nematostella vectensis]
MTSLGSPILDCFRNGSIVQLKSRSSGGTLTMREGGIVSGNGPVGFYAGRLGPRTPVWGRWTDGTYHRGTITNVGTKIDITFNDGDNVQHAINDPTAVVADVGPDPEVLKPGARVIAQFRGSTKYYAGRIVEVDSSNSQQPRCHVQFDDGDKEWAEAGFIRMLPEVAAADLGVPSIITNSRVLARWTNDQYYRGTVTNVGEKIDIKFDDGDKIQHDPLDVSAVIYDVTPSRGTLQVGVRAVGYWPDKGNFYLGRIGQVDYHNASHPRFLLNFDDGASIWCNLDEVRRVPLRREQDNPVNLKDIDAGDQETIAHFRVGCMVWGRWSDGRYFLGRVTDVRDGKIYVTFDDGDNISHDLGDVSAVIVDLVPNPTHVPIGARVIAAFEGRCHYYKGRVTQIDSTNPYAPRYHVTYDDGDKGWVNCDKVRLLPMRADEVGTRVYARWTNGQFYLGTVERVGHKIEIKYDDGDRIAHDPSDITAAVILDSTPNPGSVGRGTRVIAAWPGKEKYYLGTVDAVNKDQMYEPQYHVKYDDGDESWVTVNQLRVIPAPGPAPESQFMVVQIGADVVALNSIAHPHFYLGLEGGYLRGKWFDTYCHFYLREAPNQFMSLEACMLPGQHVGVDSKGSVMSPASVYAGTEPAMFEVKLLMLMKEGKMETWI